MQVETCLGLAEHLARGQAALRNACALAPRIDDAHTSIAQRSALHLARVSKQMVRYVHHHLSRQTILARHRRSQLLSRLPLVEAVQATVWLHHLLDVCIQRRSREHRREVIRPAQTYGKREVEVLAHVTLLRKERPLLSYLSQLTPLCTACTAAASTIKPADPVDLRHQRAPPIYRRS